MRADVFLLESGHAATRSQAQRLIASGVHWRPSPLSPWQPVAKNGADIPPGAQLHLLGAAEARYLSRAGLKLEAALGALGLCVAARRRPGGRRRCGPWPIAPAVARRRARGLRRGPECAHAHGAVAARACRLRS